MEVFWHSFKRHILQCRDASPIYYSRFVRKVCKFEPGYKNLGRNLSDDARSRGSDVAFENRHFRAVVGNSGAVGATWSTMAARRRNCPLYVTFFVDWKLFLQPFTQLTVAFLNQQRVAAHVRRTFVKAFVPS